MKKIKNSSKQKDRENKRKILDFIESNSKKSDFFHWLINNTKTVPFSEGADWEEIINALMEEDKFNYSFLRDYAITLRKGEITDEALNKVIEETEEAEEIAKKLTFLGRFKKFSIAIGGILFFIGVVKIALAISLLFFNVPILPPPFEHELFLSLVAFIGAEGIIEFLGGIFLISM